MGGIAVVMTGIFGVLQFFIKDMQTGASSFFSKIEWKLESVQKQMDDCKADCERKDKIIEDTRGKVGILEATGGKNRPTSFTLWAKMDSLHLIFDVSPSIFAILGRSPAALVGTDVNEIIPAAIRPQHHDGIERFQESGKIRSPGTLIVSKVLHQLGHEINVAVMIRPQMHRDVECMKVKVFLIDDTEA